MGGRPVFVIRACLNQLSPGRNSAFITQAKRLSRDSPGAYAFGIAKNHPFVDGNKRVAFLAAYVFLGDNGYQFTAEQTGVVLTLLKLAASELTEKEIALWIESNSRPRNSDDKR